MEILKSIEWAVNTIREKLMFGMHEAPLSAAFAREMRAKGVLIKCSNIIREQQAKIDELERENKELVETLERYANPESWVQESEGER